MRDVLLRRYASRNHFLGLAASLFVLWRMYKYAWERWLQEYSADIFWPAFPYPRTRLVLLMFVVPVWGAGMAGITLLWNAFQRLQRRKDNFGGRTRPRPAILSKFLMLYIGLALSGVFLYLTQENAIDYRYRAVVEAANRVKRPDGYGDGTKVFIGAMFFNNAAVLPYWIREFTKVIHYLGTDNVFVSVVESNSWDESAELLDEWKAVLDQLGVRHLIRTRDKSVERPANMDTAYPRIEFLAATRNLVLAPLVESGGYDIVLFSNDVFVEASAVVELLKTNNGQWDMVCGLDLHRWGMYDAWVLRDRVGDLVSSLWPYFLDEQGRQAVINDKPVPVFTCWNGITAFSSQPFLPIPLRTPGRLSNKPLATPLPSTHPSYSQSLDLLLTPAQTPPLRFRRSGDSECFNAEAYALPYDLRRQFDMQRIYLNPLVINSYEYKWYWWFKRITRHWLVRWWMNHVEEGQGMKEARMIIGDKDKVWRWDGGECHPW
ncbi:hypothetical protein HMN09_00320600 [Mycena chlorophos]|uniref:Glycosyltransferase family 69 protein n=1 Tax=Mycena chlorophos TaxID=658473 RepID=A0A8H6TIW2_MYCCL|nr:hypothetical protein HMN09_00320600 [Mycena chlorophos]